MPTSEGPVAQGAACARQLSRDIAPPSEGVDRARNGLHATRCMQRAQGGLGAAAGSLASAEREKSLEVQSCQRSLHGHGDWPHDRESFTLSVLIGVPCNLLQSNVPFSCYRPNVHHTSLDVPHSRKRLDRITVGDWTVRRMQLTSVRPASAGRRARGNVCARRAGGGAERRRGPPAAPRRYRQSDSRAWLAFPNSKAVSSRATFVG